MDKKMIVTAALVLLPVAAASVLILFTRAKKALGTMIEKTKRKNNLLIFLIPPVSVALILLCLIRDLKTAGTLGICGCGVLGFFLALKEIRFMFAAGIYEKGFILGSDFFIFGDIDRIDCSQENQLTVTTKGREQKTLQASRKEAEKILAAVKAGNPSVEIS